MPTVLLLVLTAWPQRDAAVRPLELPTRVANTKKLRVVIDAGHGAPGNDGNEGCQCQLERDHTLQVAEELIAALPKLGPFEVLRTRAGAERPDYPSRIAAAEKWKADVIVSLHSDARGVAWPWNPWGDGRVCYRNGLEPGFAVLWSDDAATAPQFARREALGRSMIRRLVEAGFVPYSGENYGSLYRPDVVPGGWIDLRPHGKNVFFLRASATIPTVIIETHHALDLDEVQRWDEPETRTAFASAVARALWELVPEPHTR